MATIDEMRQVATQIENETQVGGNTASRVGGLFNDVVDKLENVDDVTPMDEIPTFGSVKAVKSGGVKSYVDYGDSATEENLTNTITWTDGKGVVAANGTLTRTNPLRYSNQIDLSGYSSIRLSLLNRSLQYGFALYDANDTYISGMGGTGGTSPDYLDQIVQLPANARFLRFTSYKDTATYGNPYLYGYIPNGGILKAERDIRGLQSDVMDINNELEGTEAQPYTTTWENGFISSNGTLMSNSSYCRSEFIPTEKLVSVRSTNGSSLSVNCYNAEMQHIGLYQNYATEFENLPTPCAYIRIWYAHSVPATAGDFVQIMMQSGGIIPQVDALTLQAKSFTALSGKKIVTFGDSITWYDGHPYNWGKESGQTAIGYQSYMRGVGMNVINQGASGNTMLQISNIIKSYADFAQMDYCTITSGANDSRKSVPVGTVLDIGSTYDTTTFIGALQSAIDYALTQNDKLKIVLFTPIKGWIYPAGYVPARTTEGMVDEAYADAIKAVGKLYSLPVLDLFNEAGFNLLTRNVMMNDPEPPENTLYSLHPTSYGYERMASLILPFIASV